MAVSSKLRSFQANLGPLFCLFCLGQDKICNPYAGTHSPNYLLDKDLIVWGHHIRSSINSESSETRRVVLKYSRSNQYLPKISAK